MTNRLTHVILRPNHTIQELITARITDRFCAETRQTLNKGDKLAFFVDKNARVRTISRSSRHIRSGSESYTSTTIQNKLVTRVAASSTIKFASICYQPTLSVGCYASVRLCLYCVPNPIKLRKNFEKIPLSPAKAQLT